MYDGAGNGGVGRSIASGQMYEDGEVGGMTITRRFGAEPTPSASSASADGYHDEGTDHENTAVQGFSDERKSNRDSYLPKQSVYNLGGIEEEAIQFPQSTHSWLFTQPAWSPPFWFAVGIVVLSYVCLILALLNIFEESEEGNPFGVPYQVQPSVRIAQYLAMIIALIMEEEIPTGLYLLRMISKESLAKKFPKLQYWRFVIAAIVRLIMGYLFLFNTFCVVAQATAVLDIFFDVLALQFLQQLDDISFNLAKIDVFGRRMKHAALSRCFEADFEKQPFALRKRMNYFLKGVYFINMCALLMGMVWITVQQESGAFHSDSITVTFGDQIWKNAFVTLPTGVETRTLLFSYFNGEYRRTGTHHGRPVYTEVNKRDGEPFEITVGAEIKYCKEEGSWVFAHQHIRKSKNNADESDCPWLLKSAETTEYNLLDVEDSQWTIWTGSIEQGGHVSVVDNECQGPVDCNYNGMCSDEGKCVCSGGHFGLHCEHKKPCNIISGRQGGKWAEVQWADEEMRIYQRPVYAYESGATQEVLDSLGIDPMKDNIYLVYTGSRWLGTIYYGTDLAPVPRSYWRQYTREYHAFWEDVYNNRTLFASDPTTQSSIIGVDFYQLGKLGEEYGDFGELFPLSDPEGSGYMRCIDDEAQSYRSDANLLRTNVDFSGDAVGVVIEYEIRRGREYETQVLTKNCVDPAAGIGIDKTAVRTPEFEEYDKLRLEYSMPKSEVWSSNLWDARTDTMELCHLIRLLIPADGSNPRTIVREDYRLITQKITPDVIRK